MMSKTLKQTLASVIALGAKIGRDSRWSAKREFYLAAAEYLPTDKDELKAAADKLSTAGVAKKLGIPQTEVANLDDKVRSDAFPAGGTIVRFVGYVRRFPNADPETSLEVYATAAAHETRALKAASPDDKVDPEQADLDGSRLVELAIAENDGKPVSIRNARDAWQVKSDKPAAADHPENVSDRVAWLIGQPAAVAAFVADPENAESVATLVAMLTAENPTK